MDYDVVIGLDVGKSMHHACALDPQGTRLFDEEITNTEADLRAVFGCGGGAEGARHWWARASASTGATAATVPTARW